MVELSYKERKKGIILDKYDYRDNFDELVSSVNYKTKELKKTDDLSKFVHKCKGLGKYLDNHRKECIKCYEGEFVQSDLNFYSAIDSLLSEVTNYGGCPRHWSNKDDERINLIRELNKFCKQKDERKKGIILDEYDYRYNFEELKLLTTEVVLDNGDILGYNEYDDTHTVTLKDSSCTDNTYNIVQVSPPKVTQTVHDKELSKAREISEVPAAFKLSDVSTSSKISDPSESSESSDPFVSSEPFVSPEPFVSSVPFVPSVSSHINGVPETEGSSTLYHYSEKQLPHKIEPPEPCMF
ncbi:hypothetical protein PVT01_110005000 [Plasmodium vivax]|uniref:VIR protein n=1 Tax=Plasmodium vivax TaxID=5855 RepID=A0A1G4GZ84_PLAVI|nr:hypothetical protein PVT01_110005000 [Plasmodium vivax]